MLRDLSVVMDLKIAFSVLRCSYWKHCFLLLSLALLSVSGCDADVAESAGSAGREWGPRAELLTLEEAVGGVGIRSTVPGMEQATTCGPDWGSILPNFRDEYDNNTVRYAQEDRWIAVGVWNDSRGKGDRWLKRISEEMHGDSCRIGRNWDPDGSGPSGSYDWRVYPVDLGEGVVAFRSVEWSIARGAPPPTPEPRADLRVFSTARAYGLVNGKFVMVRVSHRKSEPPPEEDLRVLWEAQAAKVRFHDAAEENKKRFTPQSGSVNAPTNE